LADGTGYGTVTGLQGANCRHSFYVWFEGISKNAYDEATRNEEDSRTVTIGGKQVSLYEATQVQRSLERKIREWKRQESALLAAKQDATIETAKVKAWQKRIRQFIAETDLQRQRVREQI
jgi:hypothetical protein